MKAWHFSENAYPYLPPADEYESIRVSLPNRNYDPKKGAALYDRYIDEWLIAEDEGVEIMLNEHHQTATCVDPAAPLVLAALARLTKKARLLILGNPVANRRQPVRVAEEMAFADILSHGRIEVGFVRGVPYELSPANSNPVYTAERQWEAIDLILTGRPVGAQEALRMGLANRVVGRGEATAHAIALAQEIVVLPPISVDDWTRDDLGERVEGVRQLFVDHLDKWPTNGKVVA